MKSLFNPTTAKHTLESMALADEVGAVFQPIYDKWIAMGYSPRDISLVVDQESDIISLAAL